ncbi:electron transport complex subunit RsxG [Buchnera aphidicola]|uniref:Ion-translocating oxidoreductase complex subunit G n=1 Tax=Buchnera aphidicola subsp. Rhopalosiphum maidis TaxID=118109 RepID=A0A3G2I4R2_BUCRM|nr:electron transport complex subunit RsxG [Buchnera aphidicola]AYN24394.1 electron transport complex subunit RsxG [Buchnera aphidicola (Rhopalosiphum maidis)]
MKSFKETIINAFLMSFFSFFSLSTVVLVKNITSYQIKNIKEKEKNIFIKQVIPKSMYNTFDKKFFFVKNKLLGDKKKHSLWLLFKAKKAKAAIVESIAPDGYSGSISILVAAYFNGKIIGVRVLSHKETPGIGDKIEISISNWITKFKNMNVVDLKDKKFLLKKYGGEIEQFTGATITPQSVTNAIKRTVVFIKRLPLIFSL